MSDEPSAASFLDRVNTLSFPAVVGLGAAAGLLFAVLSALMVDVGPAASDPQSSTTPATADTATKSPVHEPVSSDAAGAGGDGRSSEGAAAANTNEVEPPPAEAEEEADVIELEPDVGTAVDVEPTPADDAATDGASDGAAPDQPSDGAAADQPADQPADSPPPPSPTGRTQADRDAEAKMTSDELLTAASEAYEDKRYKDAYRLATRSQRSRPQDKAQMLRGRSACRLRDEKNAREIVRSFKLGDEHRKTLRAFCKDRGVRVGL